MSAMLDTYDMQVLDYHPTDHDIQMHPSSSDHWFPDEEAKMEEDGPALLKDESDFNEDKASIEVDMEPVIDLPNTEYEMLDGEEETHPEILDVEVYDVSHAESPAMFSVDIVHGGSFVPFQSTVEGSVFSETSHIETPNPSLVSPEFTNVSPVTQIAYDSGIPEEISDSLQQKNGKDPENPATELPEPVTGLEKDNADPGSHTISSNELSVPAVPAEDEEHTVITISDPPYDLQDPSFEQSHEHDREVLHADGPEGDSENHHDEVASHADIGLKPVPGDNISTSDPHEISEGVYIDPPPPVLLSVSSEDQFDFSLFNEPSSWDDSVSNNTALDRNTTHVLLSAFPTLYYEPLSTVFDALRQEDRLHTLSASADAELVIEAIDLQLAISEDNVYAREVTLHDLNVLHDVSGIDGLLRMRLYTSAPRFITRYQHLQDEVSRLNLDTGVGDSVAEQNSDNILQQNDATQGDHQHLQNHNDAEATTLNDQHENLVADAPVSGHDDDAGYEAHQETDNEQVHEPLEGGEASTEDHNPDPPHLDDIHATSANSGELRGSAIEEHHDAGTVAQETNEQSTPFAGALELDGEHEIDAAAFDEVGQSVGDDLSVAAAAGEDYEGTEYEQEQHQDLVEETSFEEHEPNEDDQDEYQGQLDEEQHIDNDPEAEEYSRGDEVADHTTSHSLPTGNLEDKQEVTADSHEVSQHLEFSEPLNTQDEHANDNTGEQKVESDNTADTVATYDESFSTYTLEEFSNSEEPGQIDEHAGDNQEHDEQDWGYDFDDEGNAVDGDGGVWDEETDEASKSISNTSSATLSSKASKRGYDEIDADGGDIDDASWTPPSSPGPKRTRTQ